MAPNQQSPDDSAFAANPVTTIPADRREGFLGLLGGHGPAMTDLIKQHHDTRLANAQMYSNAAKDATSAIVHINQGIDPETGQRFDDPSYKGAGADALRAKYQANYDESWGNYKKIAGVNPDAKGALAKAEAILQHIMGQGAGAVGAPPQGGQGRTGGMTPPPTPPGGQQATVMDSGVTLAPPPTPPGQAPSSGPSVAAQAPFVRASQEEAQQFASWKKMQDVLRDNKIAENEALAKARVSNQRQPRPVSNGSMSVLDARGLATAGKVFLNTDGDPIDVTALPDSMGLKGTTLLNPDTGQWEVRYTPFSPNQASITVGNEVFAVSPMDKSKLAAGAGQALGAKAVPSTTRTTDPATGQTTVSTRTPQTQGISGRGMTPPPTPNGTGAGTTVPSVSPAPKSRQGGKSSSAPIPLAAVPALDETGHIPTTTNVSSTPQIVEGANQLLDGQDINKLPMKTRELSAKMARQYGWEQGKFTPREQGALRNATQFIDDMLKDPATFAVLDNTMSRLKLNQVLSGSEKQGTIGSTMSTVAASNMSDAEAKFVRQYNIITQTLAGIAPAIRGSGNRTTEAAIKRLLTDMPNPKTVQGAKDGIQRLQLLKKEVARALAKGTFTETQATATGGAGTGTGTGTGKGMTPPPVATGSRPPLSSFEH